MTKSPIVSVTLCCYNGEKWLAETIESVLNQTFKDLEFVIINDGSTDKTEEIIKSFSDARIMYSYQKNRGLPASRNRSIELSRGDFIAFIDQDDLWEPDLLEKQIKLFQADGEVGLVYSDCYMIKGNGERFGTCFDYKDDRPVPCRGSIVEPLLMYGNFIPLVSVIVRKNAIVEAGGFNEKLRLAEDYEAWLKICLRCKADFSPEPLCSYRCHDSNTTILQYERNMVEILQVYEWALKDLDLSAEAQRKSRELCAKFYSIYADILWHDSRRMEAIRATARLLPQDPRLFAAYIRSHWIPVTVREILGKLIKLPASQLPHVFLQTLRTFLHGRSSSS
jgi:glycosyltransferase involved in cell wall biosynthesis